MDKKAISILLIAFLLFATILVGCSSSTSGRDEEETFKIVVTDMLGRQVELKSQAQKIVAIGPGALRLCCYVDGVELLAGIEQMDKDSAAGKPYVIANPSMASLPVIGAGGPNNAPDAEKLLSINPDVIFTTYAQDKTAADNLQSKTGIPMVAISYGKVSTFDPDLYASIKLIGKLTGKEQRAQEVVDYMEKCETDLDQRTRGIPEGERPVVYIGALGARGTHGIESTQGDYSLFNAIHAKNVVDETGKTGSLMIDREKLLQWNPEKIFIDGGGAQMVQEDYKKNPEYYKALSAMQNGEIYLQLPYNSYTTNIDTAIADAYYMGKVIYPKQFDDVDPEKKADEIYKFLLGKEMYAQMVKDYGGFEKLTLN